MAIQLIKEQREAVNTQHKYNLVLAGPGSGKTTVLAHFAIKQAKELNRLNGDKGSVNKYVLVFSHTRNARDELKKEIEKLVPTQRLLENIKCTTFHGFALKILKNYCSNVYYLGDDFDEKTVRKIIAGGNFNQKLTVKKAWEIVSLYRDSIGTGNSINSLINKQYVKFSGYEKDINKIICELEKRIAKSGKVSVGKLTSLFMQDLKRGKISSLFAKGIFSVIVDEFQDTLNSQWEMIQVIAGKDKGLLVAGDPGQTIFIYSGASLDRFEQYRTKYPRFKEYHLKHNHRSPQRIVNFCKAILDQSVIPDKLVTKAKEEGKRPVVVCSSNILVLCEQLASKFEKQRFKSGNRLDECAVIYRFNNDKKMLTEQLYNKRVPYKKFEKRSRKEIKFIQLISALNRIVNKFNKKPEKRILKDWGLILENIKGIGIESKNKIINDLRDKKASKFAFKTKPRYSESLKKLMESLAKISQRTSIDRPPAQLQAILDLINQMPKVNKKSREVELASLFYYAYGSVSLREALKKYKDPSFPTCYPAGTRRPPFPTDFLTLSTIHKIKGSGFKNVYYLGTDDSFFKRHHLMKGEKEQQEILLMNVACSRAKKKLTLLFPISKADFKLCDKHPNPWNIICKIPRACYELKKHLV